MGACVCVEDTSIVAVWRGSGLQTVSGVPASATLVPQLVVTYTLEHPCRVLATILPLGSLAVLFLSRPAPALSSSAHWDARFRPFS